MDCLLCGERPGQLRLELRQPGVETWIGPAACGVASTFAIWAWRIRPALTTASHLRLHVLHCTWLI